MIAKETIKKILEAGVQAPSGSNSQPWKFYVEGEKVKVQALFSKDHPVLNFRNRGTFIAHGALLENIFIAAQKLGYRARFKMFPDGKQNDIICEIYFEDNQNKGHVLYDLIFKRCTNRKPYKKKLLGDSQKKDLLNLVNDLPAVKIKFVDDIEGLKVLAESACVSEKIIFEDKGLHQLLYKELVFTEKEEKNIKSGLYIKTLELNAFQTVILKLVKFWPIANFLNKIGFSRLLAKDNYKRYVSSAAIGAIIVKNKDEFFIEGGRAIERIWLKATQMGLSIQLLTGFSFFWQRVISGENIFSASHRRIIENAYEKSASVLDIREDQVIAALFRIGESSFPSAYSSKKTPEIYFK